MQRQYIYIICKNRKQMLTVEWSKRTSYFPRIRSRSRIFSQGNLSQAFVKAKRSDKIRLTKFISVLCTVIQFTESQITSKF